MYFNPSADSRLNQFRDKVNFNNLLRDRDQIKKINEKVNTNNQSGVSRTDDLNVKKPSIASLLSSILVVLQDIKEINVNKVGIDEKANFDSLSKFTEFGERIQFMMSSQEKTIENMVKNKFFAVGNESQFSFLEVFSKDFKTFFKTNVTDIFKTYIENISKGKVYNEALDKHLSNFYLDKKFRREFDSRNKAAGFSVGMTKTFTLSAANILQVNKKVDPQTLTNIFLANIFEAVRYIGLNQQAGAQDMTPAEFLSKLNADVELTMKDHFLQFLSKNGLGQIEAALVPFKDIGMFAVDFIKNIPKNVLKGVSTVWKVMDKTWQVLSYLGSDIKDVIKDIGIFYSDIKTKLFGEDTGGQSYSDIFKSGVTKLKGSTLNTLGFLKDSFLSFGTLTENITKTTVDFSKDLYNVTSGLLDATGTFSTDLGSLFTNLRNNTTNTFMSFGGVVENLTESVAGGASIFKSIANTGMEAYKKFRDDKIGKELSEKFKSNKKPEIITSDAVSKLPNILEQSRVIQSSILEVSQNTYSVMGKLLESLTGNIATYVEHQKDQKQARVYIADTGQFLESDEYEKYQENKTKEIQEAIINKQGWSIKRKYRRGTLNAEEMARILGVEDTVRANTELTSRRERNFASTATLPAFAEGGVAKQGEFAFTGEKGLEIILPEEDSRVLSNTQIVSKQFLQLRDFLAAKLSNVGVGIETDDYDVDVMKVNRRSKTFTLSFDSNAGFKFSSVTEKDDVQKEISDNIKLLTEQNKEQVEYFKDENEITLNERIAAIKPKKDIEASGVTNEITNIINKDEEKEEKKDDKGFLSSIISSAISTITGIVGGSLSFLKGAIKFAVKNPMIALGIVGVGAIVGLFIYLKPKIDEFIKDAKETFEVIKWRMENLFTGGLFGFGNKDMAPESVEQAEIRKQRDSAREELEKQQSKNSDSRNIFTGLPPEQRAATQAAERKVRELELKELEAGIGGLDNTKMDKHKRAEYNERVVSQRIENETENNKEIIRQLTMLNNQFKDKGSDGGREITEAEQLQIHNLEIERLETQIRLDKHKLMYEQQELGSWWHRFVSSVGGYDREFYEDRLESNKDELSKLQSSLPQRAEGGFFPTDSRFFTVGEKGTEVIDAVNKYVHPSVEAFKDSMSGIGDKFNVKDLNIKVSDTFKDLDIEERIDYLKDSTLPKYLKKNEKLLRSLATELNKSGREYQKFLQNLEADLEFDKILNTISKKTGKTVEDIMETLSPDNYEKYLKKYNIDLDKYSTVITDKFDEFIEYNSWLQDMSDKIGVGVEELQDQVKDISDRLEIDKMLKSVSDATGDSIDFLKDTLTVDNYENYLRANGIDLKEYSDSFKQKFDSIIENNEWLDSMGRSIATGYDNLKQSASTGMTNLAQRYEDSDLQTTVSGLKQSASTGMANLAQSYEDVDLKAELTRLQEQNQGTIDYLKNMAIGAGGTAWDMGSSIFGAGYDIVSSGVSGMADSYKLAMQEYKRKREDTVVSKLKSEVPEYVYPVDSNKYLVKFADGSKYVVSKNEMPKAYFEADMNYKSDSIDDAYGSNAATYAAKINEVDPITGKSESDSIDFAASITEGKQVFMDNFGAALESTVVGVGNMLGTASAIAKDFAEGDDLGNLFTGITDKVQKGWEATGIQTDDGHKFISDLRYNMFGSQLDLPTNIESTAPTSVTTSAPVTVTSTNTSSTVIPKDIPQLPASAFNPNDSSNVNNGLYFTSSGVPQLTPSRAAAEDARNTPLTFNGDVPQLPVSAFNPSTTSVESTNTIDDVQTVLKNSWFQPGNFFKYDRYPLETRAEGGPFNPFTPTLVGEDGQELVISNNVNQPFTPTLVGVDGPEIIVPEVDGYVVPSNITEKLLNREDIVINDIKSELLQQSKNITMDDVQREIIQKGGEYTADRVLKGFGLNTKFIKTSPIGFMAGKLAEEVYDAKGSVNMSEEVYQQLLKDSPAALPKEAAPLIDAEVPKQLELRSTEPFKQTENLKNIVLKQAEELNRVTFKQAEELNTVILNQSAPIKKAVFTKAELPKPATFNYARQFGGPVSAGDKVLVGEDGKPETFIPIQKENGVVIGNTRLEPFFKGLFDAVDNFGKDKVYPAAKPPEKFTPKTFTPEKFTPTPAKPLEKFTPKTFTPETFTPKTFTPEKFIPTPAKPLETFTPTPAKPLQEVASTNINTTDGLHFVGDVPQLASTAFIPGANSKDRLYFNGDVPQLGSQKAFDSTAQRLNNIKKENENKTMHENIGSIARNIESMNSDVNDINKNTNKTLKDLDKSDTSGTSSIPSAELSSSVVNGMNSIFENAGYNTTVSSALATAGGLMSGVKSNIAPPSDVPQLPASAFNPNDSSNVNNGLYFTSGGVPQLTPSKDVNPIPDKFSATDPKSIKSAEPGISGSAPPPNGISTSLSTIKTKSGKTATVGSTYAANFQGFINEFESMGYQIKSLGGYANRDIAGRPGTKSYHAYGAAIDINPPQNPMGSTLVTDMPSNTGEIAKKYGLGWGGDWRSVKDAMHFSIASSEGGSIKIDRKSTPPIGPNASVSTSSISSTPSINLPATDMQSMAATLTAGMTTPYSAITGNVATTPFSTPNVSSVPSVSSNVSTVSPTPDNFSVNKDSGIPTSTGTENMQGESATQTSGVNGGLKVLLDEISEGEGTSDADAQKRGLSTAYDITLGYGAYGNLSKPVSQMTLAELDQYQTSMLQDPKNKLNSSAAGKYQIIRTTLRTLKKQLGLSDDVLFDAKTQDAMALELLKGRGFDKWKSGQMSDSSFQMALSQEWASIARPDTGKSYYGQATGTSSEEIQSAMAAAKGSNLDNISGFNTGTTGGGFGGETGGFTTGGGFGGETGGFTTGGGLPSVMPSLGIDINSIGNPSSSNYQPSGLINNSLSHSAISQTMTPSQLGDGSYSPINTGPPQSISDQITGNDSNEFNNLGYSPVTDLKSLVNTHGSPNIDGLNPGFRDQFARMLQDYYAQGGAKIQVNSAFRTREEQAALFAKYGPGRAAKPGNSRHESGVAIDINSVDANGLDQMGMLKKYGFNRPVSNEAWHIEPISRDSYPTGTQDAPANASISSSDITNMSGVGSMSGISISPDQNISGLLPSVNIPSMSAMTNSGIVGPPQPTNIFSSIGNAIGGTISNIGNAVGGFVSNPIDSIRNMVGDLIPTTAIPTTQSKNIPSTQYDHNLFLENFNQGLIDQTYTGQQNLDNTLNQMSELLTRNSIAQNTQTQTPSDPNDNTQRPASNDQVGMVSGSDRVNNNAKADPFDSYGDSIVQKLFSVVPTAMFNNLRNLATANTGVDYFEPVV